MSFTPTPDNASDASADLRRSARLRLIGTTVLVLGILLAAFVYLTGKPPTDLSNAIEEAQDYKKQGAAAEAMAGKAGLWMTEWWADLQRPDVEAIIIVVVAAGVSWGCFLNAKR